MDAFTYNVVDYNIKKNEYTLRHPRTGEIKIISKADFDYLSAQMKENRQNKKSVKK